MRLIYITVAWALGISLARSLPGVEAVYWLAICAAAASIAALLRRHRLRWILALTAAFAAGGARLSVMPRSSEIAAYNGASGTITGVVVAEPRVRDDRVQLRVEVESIFVNSADMAVNGLALVESGRFSDVRYGDRIRATGALETPAVWDRFSYADYLGRQGIFSMMRHAGLEVLESGQGQPFAAALLALKDVMRRVIATALPEPQAGLLTGILLGDERGISPGLADDFARVGASHVIAISGFNMVVVSAIVIRILSSLFAGNRLIVACGAVAVIAVYSLLVGASPGILRAALMSSLLVIGSQLKRRTFVPTSLAFATLLLSAGDPHVLLDIGFQLSFCAVLGLGLFVEPLSRIFRRLLELMLPARLAAISDSVLKEPLIVSIAAQISTLPLVIFYFDRLSLVALPVQSFDCAGAIGSVAARFVGGHVIRLHSRARQHPVLGGLCISVLDDLGRAQLCRPGFRGAGPSIGRATDSGLLHIDDRRRYDPRRPPANVAAIRKRSFAECGLLQHCQRRMHRLYSHAGDARQSPGRPAECLAA